MSPKNKIGQIIREQRTSIPLTFGELSRASGVSISFLARIEKGERIPSPHTLQKLARPLGFDLDELLILGGFLSRSAKFSDEERKKLADWTVDNSRSMDETTEQVKKIYRSLVGKQ